MEHRSAESRSVIKVKTQPPAKPARAVALARNPPPPVLEPDHNSMVDDAAALITVPVKVLDAWWQRLSTNYKGQAFALFLQGTAGES
jgi:hypothetical protein